MTTGTDDRYYAAVEADDCHADELLRGFLKRWRKLHRVCEECFLEDDLHEPTCSHYRGEEPQLEAYDRRRDDREMARDLTKENDDD